MMFDDRLEIYSPGKLPNIVTVENIKHERFSRNPRIARTLTEFGWVREMNEGVKRIYSEMESYLLHEPKYTELQVALFLHKLLETIWIRCYIWLTQLIQNFLETYEQIVQLVKHGFPPVMFFSLLI